MVIDFSFFFFLVLCFTRLDLCLGEMQCKHIICAGASRSHCATKMVRGRSADDDYDYDIESHRCCCFYVCNFNAHSFNRLQTVKRELSVQRIAQDLDYQWIVTALKQTVNSTQVCLNTDNVMWSCTVSMLSERQKQQQQQRQKKRYKILKQGKWFPVSIRCGNSNRNHSIMCTIASNEKDFRTAKAWERARQKTSWMVRAREKGKRKNKRLTEIVSEWETVNKRCPWKEIERNDVDG